VRALGDQVADLQCADRASRTETCSWNTDSAWAGASLPSTPRAEARRDRTPSKREVGPPSGSIRAQQGFVKRVDCRTPTRRRGRPFGRRGAVEVDAVEGLEVAGGGGRSRPCLTESAFSAPAVLQEDCRRSGRDSGGRRVGPWESLGGSCLAATSRAVRVAVPRRASRPTLAAPPRRGRADHGGTARRALVAARGEAETGGPVPQAGLGTHPADRGGGLQRGRCNPFEQAGGIDLSRRASGTDATGFSAKDLLTGPRIATTCRRNMTAGTLGRTISRPRRGFMGLIRRIGHAEGAAQRRVLHQLRGICACKRGHVECRRRLVGRSGSLGLQLTPCRFHEALPHAARHSGGDSRGHAASRPRGFRRGSIISTAGAPRLPSGRRSGEARTDSRLLRRR